METNHAPCSRWLHPSPAEHSRWKPYSCDTTMRMTLYLFVFLKFWMEIRGGGEIILWPGTGDFQVDSNKSSSHSLEPIIGRVLQSHTFTAAPLEWFCFLHFVFTFGDLKHRQSHQMHWHPLCLLEHSSTPQICHLFLGSCGRGFHSEYSRYGHTCQKIHWPNTSRQG